MTCLRTPRPARATALALALILLGPAPRAAALDYPPTPKQAVRDTLQGVVVDDDYRWLENTESPQVGAWIEQQNALTRRVLDALPRRQAIKDELLAMVGSGRASRHSFEFVSGRLFALKRQPPANQELLVTLAADGDPASERTVLDPNRLDPSGKTTIDWFKPSPDGRLVAVSLSTNGSEDGTLHLYRSADGQALADVLPRVQYPTGGGSVAWSANSKAFHYTRYPQGTERPAADVNFYQQVWFHRVGRPVGEDRRVLGDDLPRIAETVLRASDDGRHLLADVANGDGGEHRLYLRSGRAGWRRIADFDNGLRRPRFGLDGRLYAIAHQGSPRGRIVAMRLDDPRATLPQAPTVVPESDAVLEDLLPTANRLYVQRLVGGPSELHVHALDGRLLGAVDAQPVASVNLGVRLGGDAILFGSESFVKAFAWYRHDGARAAVAAVRTGLSEAPPFAVDGELPGAEAVREFATSKDGTRVPMTVVRARGTPLDGTQPVLLVGYGGYGISMRPRFSRQVAAWLRHGGVYALANLRGGGEFGEAWHLAGNLTRKQNVFDDFIACGEALVALGYTRPQRLAIQGGSNGGLLMGAALVQRPELFAAVASSVGLYDMLRVELTPNGAFNVTEFGSVRDPLQFKALYDYSPLHHVVDGTAYPALLLTTGLHDGRVAPWMSYKMAARLQAANPAGRPVLLRVAGDAGHGMGTSLASAVDEQADILAFLFDRLAMR